MATVDHSKPGAPPVGKLQGTVSSGPPEGWNEFVAGFGYRGYFQRVEWMNVLRDGLRHEPWFISAHDDNAIVGVLPLAFVKGPLFGRFLVSLPYLNTSGVLTTRNDAATAMIDEAVKLAEKLDVKKLELRHEREVVHPALPDAMRQKVHMRLALPASEDEMWSALKSKVRSQIKKPRGNEKLSVAFGTHELLDEYYSIFCSNMRDLGTPPFSKKLFAAMLTEFPGEAEICSVRFDGIPVAAAFLIHGPDVTTVPSASALRKYNFTSCNMLMYWHLLVRAIERGQSTFDFGRSSEDSGTYKFKKQWGSEPCPAVWQYHVRQGEMKDMRPDGGKYDRVIQIWQKLPVWVTKVIGPEIVRGIP